MSDTRTALGIATEALERLGASRERGIPVCGRCDYPQRACDEDARCSGAIAREALSAMRAAPVSSLADDTDLLLRCAHVLRMADGKHEKAATVIAGLVDTIDAYQREKAGLL
jgi:hypothetical protein